MKQKTKKKLKIPKTVQDTIPYEAVYEDGGLIEITPGVFTKAYKLSDINYQIAKIQEQEEMFLRFGEFLNSFDPSINFQIVILNKNMNQNEFESKTLLRPRYDKFDGLREEYNDMLFEKMSEGRNNLLKEKCLVVAVEADSSEQARQTFIRLDSEIALNIKKIGGAEAVPYTAFERLEMLYDIYNIGLEGTFGNKVTKFGREVGQFSFESMRKMGLTTKDCIGPDSFEFKKDYMRIGDKYACAMYLKDLPTYMADNVLAEISNVSCNMLTSLQYQSVSSEEALKIVKNQMVNINANMVERQKKASKAGYSVDLISPELQKAQEEANELLQDLTSKNQKMFLLSLIIVHFADSLDELHANTDIIQSTARRYMVQLRVLHLQQENGLTSALPLAYNKVFIQRTLTTESTAVFMPYVSQELMQAGGMYYGLNAVSRNLLLFDRKRSKNQNGFILGTPGSGKSFSAKREMLNVLLNTNDDVIVIDPESEYSRMAELLNNEVARNLSDGEEFEKVAEVVRVAIGSDVYINPLDMDPDYADEDDPIALKTDFTISLCEAIMKNTRTGLTAQQEAIIDKCVGIIYEDFMSSGENGGQYDKDKLPTLMDLQRVLEEQTGYEAGELASALERYTRGSANIFAHHTNVEYNSRFVVYDIRDVGTSLKPVAMLTVLDNVWNRIIENKKKGRNTWFYVDEIYLLFKTETSADFLRELWKRARKWGGVPTGITQNVADLLGNDTARTMISNCEFIQMLNQAPLDRNDLAVLLNISPTQLSYITNSQPGEGLIYTGSSIIPFVDKFPKNTRMYNAMTSKMEEVKAIEESKKVV